MTKLRPVLTVPETAKALRVSRATVYRLINAGELQTSNVGTAKSPLTRVFEDSVAAMLERRASKPAKRGRAA